MSIKEDITDAKDIIRDNNYERVLFTDKSFIYRSTNENINNPIYRELLSSNRSVLSVIGSGDQILNSILFDSYNIDAFDISKFPKYFLEFKIAAIKKLSYDEYLSMFYDNLPFSKKLYKKVLDGLKGEPKEFWESIAKYKGLSIGKNNYSPRDVYFSNLFEKGQTSSIKAITNNPYLNRYYYTLLKRKLSNASINYINGNIIDICNNLEKGYDLINLSNICMYESDAIKSVSLESTTDKYKDLVTNLKINPNGKVLSYFMGYVIGGTIHRYIDKFYIKDPRFDVYEVHNENDINDAIVVYSKTR
jgi:hypothetical protein